MTKDNNNDQYLSCFSVPTVSKVLCVHHLVLKIPLLVDESIRPKVVKELCKVIHVSGARL